MLVSETFGEICQTSWQTVFINLISCHLIAYVLIYHSGKVAEISLQYQTHMLIQSNLVCTCETISSIARLLMEVVLTVEEVMVLTKQESCLLVKQSTLAQCQAISHRRKKEQSWKNVSCSRIALCVARDGKVIKL